MSLLRLYMFQHRYSEVKYLNFFVFPNCDAGYPYCDIGVRIEEVANHGARFLLTADHVLFVCLTNEPTNTFVSQTRGGMSFPHYDFCEQGERVALTTCSSDATTMPPQRTPSTLLALLNQGCLLKHCLQISIHSSVKADVHVNYSSLRSVAW